MARDYQFLVGAADAGTRLDVYLQARLPQEISRAMIQRAIQEGHIDVGGVQKKANYRVRDGDTITARIEELPPKPGSTPLYPEHIPIEIVYEDETVLVVNKPPGLVTHPAPGHWGGTLVNAVLWHLTGGERETLEEDLPRAGIVHRLDKDTSGLLLIAKTARAHHTLAKQLKVRNLKRGYIALVDGAVSFDEGSIDAAIARHPTNRKEMAIQHLGGRHAVTHYRVMRRYTETSHEPEVRALAQAHGRPYSLVDIELETGRTHQIRVHFAHIRYPVLGDPVYGKALNSFWHAQGIQRQLLHAWRLAFQHPVNHNPVVAYAPLPEDMRRFMDAAALKWLADEASSVRPGYWRKVRRY